MQEFEPLPQDHEATDHSPEEPVEETAEAEASMEADDEYVEGDGEEATDEEATDELATEEAGEEAVAEPVPDNMQWYIIHTYSGFERKVVESLRTRADAFGFGEEIGQILIPEEEVVELRNGKKVTSKRLLYPGYLVVQMAMRNPDGSSNDQLWHRVKDTPPRHRLRRWRSGPHSAECG